MSTPRPTSVPPSRPASSLHSPAPPRPRHHPRHPQREHHRGGRKTQTQQPQRKHRWGQSIQAENRKIETTIAGQQRRAPLRARSTTQALPLPLPPPPATTMPRKALNRRNQRKFRFGRSPFLHPRRVDACYATTTPTLLRRCRPWRAGRLELTTLRSFPASPATQMATASPLHVLGIR